MYPGEAEQLSADLAHASASAVWSRALETFGDETKARHWMNTPRDIFKGRIAAGSRQHRRSRRAAARAHGSDSNRLRRLLITSPILITTPNENLPDAPRGAVGGELFRGRTIPGQWRPVVAGIRQALRCFTLRSTCLWPALRANMIETLLVHLDKSELPRDYVWSWTELRGTPSFLRWSDLSRVSSCQAAGQGPPNIDGWVNTAGQLAIQAPSVVIRRSSTLC